MGSCPCPFEYPAERASVVINSSACVIMCGELCGRWYMRGATTARVGGDYTLLGACVPLCTRLVPVTIVGRRALTARTEWGRGLHECRLQ